MKESTIFKYKYLKSQGYNCTSTIEIEYFYYELVEKI